VAVLVIGTDGFGADAHILGRPGHRRRLKALSRRHGGRIWVKPDLLDIATAVPDAVWSDWPEIPSALNSYARVIYAATPVRSAEDGERVADLLDLFFDEHRTPLTGKAKERWNRRTQGDHRRNLPELERRGCAGAPARATFRRPRGPRPARARPGSHGASRTRSALPPGSSSIRRAPTRTSSWACSLGPVGSGLAFEVRPGDLLRANQAAGRGEHVLVVDEINRADLGRVLGESILLFEAGDGDRAVNLPHVPEGYPEVLRLHPNLRVLATRNTADRSIARMDVAIRRRFAFVEVWPQLGAVEAEGLDFAQALFTDAVYTFAEYADEETLRAGSGARLLHGSAPGPACLGPRRSRRPTPSARAPPLAP
jgi:5-methylcytosine-specific restriction protein B